VRRIIMLNLTILPELLAICRLDSSAAVPGWAEAGGFYSVTRSRDELSVVVSQQVVPDGAICEMGWRCLKVDGPLDFGLTGILASLAALLAEASISIFAISTYDTDYVLVKEDSLMRAVDALRQAGHTIGTAHTGPEED
jgi:uncharacterized protein